MLFISSFTFTTLNFRKEQNKPISPDLSHEKSYKVYTK